MVDLVAMAGRRRARRVAWIEPGQRLDVRRRVAACVRGNGAQVAACPAAHRPRTRRIDRAWWPAPWHWGMAVDRALGPARGRRAARRCGVAAHAARRRARARRIGARAGHAGIALWSFLMATAHGSRADAGAGARAAVPGRQSGARDHRVGLAAARSGGCRRPHGCDAGHDRCRRQRRVRAASPCTLACRALSSCAGPGPRHWPSPACC